MSKLSKKAKIILICGVIGSLGIAFAVYGISRSKTNDSDQKQDNQDSTQNNSEQKPKESINTPE
ncbi:hypothetical protein [Ureaplasma zalophigenitalium]|uniref:Uncharacterized protein n=1 Tax=Ureaplasma zalophigenitalium TaxID=907723 RepID=A0ABT3BPT8_9BACT|nr:hypothetical protein [Ureaplasma zalophigenitalium]MCV3754213.1 hypothetical protein [Ureaplasma zalophigenitalium]